MLLFLLPFGRPIVFVDDASMMLMMKAGTMMQLLSDDWTQMTDYLDLTQFQVKYLKMNHGFDVAIWDLWNGDIDRSAT